MANLTLHFLLIFLYFHCIAAISIDSVTSQNPDVTNFIITSCNTTLYPTVCVQTLSAYTNTIQLTNEQQLAHASLLASLSKARIAASYISKLMKLRRLKTRELQAAKDCSFTMNDCVYQLNRTIPELGQSGKLASKRDEFNWHASNVQTWTSAALTDENTCLDMINNPFIDTKIKDSIRVRVFVASQVTSNALALVHQFVERHS